MNTNKQTSLIIIMLLIIIIAVLFTISSKNKKVAISQQEAIRYSTEEETITTTIEKLSSYENTKEETKHYAFATDVYQKEGETFVVLDYVAVITCDEEKYKNDRNVCDENGAGISPGGNLNLKNENPKLRTFSLKNTKISLLQAYTDKNPDSSGQPKQIQADEFYRVLIDAKNNPTTALNKYYSVGHTNSWNVPTPLIPQGYYFMLFSAVEKDGELVELFQNYQA